MTRPASVLVVGAGLSGLAAAREIEDRGVQAIVVEARNRVGGRVWTDRNSFRFGQHAEVGADIIEGEQEAVQVLARRLGLPLAPILRRGLGYYGPDRSGRERRQSMQAGFEPLRPALEALVRELQLLEQQWDSAVAQRLACVSVAAWIRRLPRLDAAARRLLQARVRSLRGLFLADPDELSLIALVDFFADNPFASLDKMFRVRGGNDTLASALAATLRTRPMLNRQVRRLRQRDGRVTASIEHNGSVSELDADAAVVTAPPPLVAEMTFEPALPETQRTAFERLHMGAATRLLLQFSTKFWRARRQADLFGTPNAIGAVWDGNEQQRGRAGILTLLAGGGASHDLARLLEQKPVSDVAARLRWLGRPSPLVAARHYVWTDDRFARGGYAVFGPDFDPAWRGWLRRSAGRVYFAGEHTSLRWQGYINGAIESGQRAALEALAEIHRAA